MLGKHHVSLTVATMIPFIVPLMFADNNTELIPVYILFLVSGVIGSLIPDADCGGKPKLYYDFKPVYDAMITIQKLVVWIFRTLDQKDRLTLECQVDHSHRGIMHSPVGVIISSVLLTLLALVASIFLGFNTTMVLFIFVGLLSGQFLHLIEDSCTRTGINWKFPFGLKQIKGNIITVSSSKIKDYRPSIYEISLWGITGILIFGYAFEVINFAYYLVYPLIFLVVVIMWIIIIYISKSTNKIWYQ
ncbi:MAG: metal-dependent hydrolase [Methanohalobium sp.]|uniref:metal-dependent hydrolase n=1 Tax=Methanohalobium sp. TaxID=2837493 RepID=UPI00397DCC1F